MKNFKGRLAVVTGGASGMGYELVLALVKAGCHVATCDLLKDDLKELEAACKAAAPDVRLTVHGCDVSSEVAVNAFRDEVAKAHNSKHINLLFNNAGIGGGGSFVTSERDQWERTFNVCWFGVYYCSRAFMPMLVASDEGYLVNTSSVNGFWASVGPNTPHTSYSAAKFAVKGFSEAMIADLRLHAPHVKVAVVMPGHISTGIIGNSSKILGGHVFDLDGEAVDALRQKMAEEGMPVSNLPDEEIIQLSVKLRDEDFRTSAPTSSAQAANYILSEVRKGSWRILVGEDAHFLDELVRSSPEDAYEPEYVHKVTRTGHMQGLVDAVER